jgi:hypothetical protein
MQAWLSFGANSGSSDADRGLVERTRWRPGPSCCAQARRSGPRIDSDLAFAGRDHAARQEFEGWCGDGALRLMAGSAGQYRRAIGTEACNDGPQE